MPPQAPPDPITVEQAIAELLIILSRIRHKLKTLIDYHIYPNIVPHAIKDYDPRLLILQRRLQSLATLSFPKLPYIIDNSDHFASHFIQQIAEQMLHSTVGIQRIFVDHYERDLDRSRPFEAIWANLDYRMMQIANLAKLNPSNPRHLRAEDMRPNELGNFCRGALQISNGNDRGRISFLDTKDLSEDNRQKLKAFGGAYLNWECPECSHKVRFHVSSSTTSNIYTTDEIRQHNGLAIQYRSMFLAKCHLYVPPSEKTPNSFDRVRRRDPKLVGPSPLKYGCVFCFACGSNLVRGRSAFTAPQALAEHIVLRHKRRPPPTMMLHLFAIAIEGKIDDPRKRWDVNLL